MRLSYAMGLGAAALILVGGGCASSKPATTSTKSSGPLSFVVGLSAQNNSGETGTVNLLPVSATQTKVEVTVSGAPAGSQPMHIHLGSCATLGGVKYPLNNLVDGKAETILDVTTNQLVAELPLAINVHKSPQETGVYVACGNIPSGE